MARLIARKQPGAPKRVVADETTRSQQRQAAAHEPLLTYAEEIDLCRRIQAGDRKASNELVQRNLALAMDYAARYMGSRLTVGSLTYDDVYQNAVLGLIHAAKRYNGENRYSTYATWWMRQSVNRGAEQEADAIRLPSYVHTAIRKTNRAVEAGEPVDPVDAEHAASVPEMPISLHTEVFVGHQDSVTLADLVEDERANKTDAVIERLDAVETLEWIRGHLTPTEWMIFSNRITMDQDVTLGAVGPGYGRETIRQIELRASRKLRALGLCQDGSIRPHGPIARAARREIDAIAEKQREAHNKSKTRGRVARSQTSLQASA